MTTTTSPANTETLDAIEHTAARLRALDSQQRAAKAHLRELASYVDVTALSDYDLVRLAGPAFDGRIVEEVRRRTGHTFLEFNHRPQDVQYDTLGPVLSLHRINDDPQRLAEDILEFKRRFGQPGKSMRVTVDDVDILVLTTENVRTLTDALVLAGHRAEDEATR